MTRANSDTMVRVFNESYLADDSYTCPLSCIVIPHDRRTQLEFRQRCELLHAHLNIIQKESNGRRIKVLWCFNGTHIMHRRRKPFNHRVSIKFMYYSAFCEMIYPTESFISTHQYDVVIFEDMLQEESTIRLLQELILKVDSYSGVSIVTSEEKFKYLLDCLG